MLQNTVQLYLVISAIVFGLVAIIHLIRAVNGWSFVIGPITIPVWGSWIGFILTAALCLWSVSLVAL
jgi:hypothetical protein